MFSTEFFGLWVKIKISVFVLGRTGNLYRNKLRADKSWRQK